MSSSWSLSSSSRRVRASRKVSRWRKAFQRGGGGGGEGGGGGGGRGAGEAFLRREAEGSETEMAGVKHGAKKSERQRRGEEKEG